MYIYKPFFVSTLYNRVRGSQKKLPSSCQDYIHISLSLQARCVTELVVSRRNYQAVARTIYIYIHIYIYIYIYIY